MSGMQSYWKQIVKKLTDKGFTISTMESCTGGGIANTITNISGASSVLRESFVTYCNDAKIKLGVPREVIEKHTVYSMETAMEMAKAAKKQANSDIAIGVTGQLGRIDPNNESNDLNSAWYAIIDADDVITVAKVNVPGIARDKQKELIITAIAIRLLDVI